MNTVSINGQTFKIPQRWDELTVTQFRAMVRIIDETPLYTEARLLFFLVFTGIRIVRVENGELRVENSYQFRYRKQTFYMLAWQFVEIIKLFDWIFVSETNKKNENTGHYAVECRLTRNLLPFIRVPRFSLFHSPLSILNSQLSGPSDGLTNLRFSEYIYAETEHAKYLDTAKEAHLSRMIAVLYRPVRRVNTHSTDWNGDYRQPFNPYHTTRIARMAARLPVTTRHMILMWYEGCQLMLMSRFPDTFCRIPERKKKPRSEVFQSFMQMVNALSADDVTRKDAVRDAFLYDALSTINEMCRRQAELEAKYPELKKGNKKVHHS